MAASKRWQYKRWMQPLWHHLLCYKVPFKGLEMCVLNIAIVTLWNSMSQVVFCQSQVASQWAFPVKFFFLILKFKMYKMLNNGMKKEERTFAWVMFEFSSLLKPVNCIHLFIVYMLQKEVKAPHMLPFSDGDLYSTNKRHVFVSRTQ